MTHSVSTTNTNKKNDRQKIFNVIYFIDSSKTRSLKLPLPWLRVILGAAVVLFIWTITSVLTIYNLIKSQSENEHKLQSYLSAIFAYQSRYDSVFEKAYPDFNSATAILADNQKSQSKTEDPPPAKPQAPEHKIEAKDTKPIVIAEVKPGSILEKSDTPPSIQSIKIENPEYKIRNNGLTLRFSLRNDAPNTKAEGFIWGIAKFKPMDGESLYIGAPDGINISDDGSPTQPRASYRYSIKYYKVKDLSFAVPSGKTGRFESIQIGVMDKDGKKNVTDIPVTSQTTVSGALPSPPIAIKTEPIETTPIESTPSKAEDSVTTMQQGSN